MSIREIARLARVSTSTVSRTVNYSPTVHRRLARRVWKAIEAVGYYPNTQARALACGKSRILGLIVSEISNPSFSQIIQSFEEIAERHNYEILLSSAIQSSDHADLAARRMIEGRVDGVAIITFGGEEPLIECLQRRQIPFVVVGDRLHFTGARNIHVNYRRGIRQAVQHLAALKHERIGFITGPLHLPSALAQKNAFEECMREIRLPVRPQSIVVGNHTVEGGSMAMRQIMAASNRPSAVICSNDMTALGLMQCAFQGGIRIPEDLSLVGFGDIRIAQFTTPTLTTIQISQSKLAEYAVTALRSELEGLAGSNPAQNYEILTDLVLRKSTAQNQIKRAENSL